MSIQAVIADVHSPNTTDRTRGAPRSSDLPVEGSGGFRSN